MNRLTRVKVKALFELAGFGVYEIKPLINGYGYDPDDPRWPNDTPLEPWWFVKTGMGWIEIGWRKRVISIDWSETHVRAIVTCDETTKDDHSVHAWSEEKALEYLKSLYIEAKNQIIHKIPS